MMKAFNAALWKDLFSFLKKAFLEDQGQPLGEQPYLEYMSFQLSKILQGEKRLFLINLPPQHLKTFATICLIAWFLGHKPKRRVLVVGYSAEHAESISRKVRSIMRSDWYRSAFRARISASRSSAANFETTDGGSVYAVSANGSVTGRRADLIVNDDPVQILDCDNDERLSKVNRQFYSLIMSRVSNPAKGRVVIVAHRLHQNDISGHVLEQGGFEHICLPAIAPRKKRFDMDERTWVRRKGEPLRPDQYTNKVVARLRKSVLVPGFETLYQQNAQASLSLRLTQEDFILRDLRPMPELPIVLSVDPGAGAFSGRSYSVIQLWLPLGGGNHLLWDEFRDRCGFRQLWEAFKHLARRTPSAILIENTAAGPALIDRAQGNSRYNVIPVTATRGSKEERLRRHIPLMRKRPIQLRLGGEWVEDYLAEMSEFPSSQFTDQIDATSMYLDFMAQNPNLSASARGGFIAGHNRWGRMHPLVPVNTAAGVAVSAPSTLLSRPYCP